MFVFTKKDIIFYIIIIFLITCTIFTPLSLKQFKTESMSTTSNLINEKIKVVIDAGHGEPDGGAVSKDGVKESELNLQIAQRLEEKLKECNFEIIMTRKNENNIALESVQEKTIREIKTSDLNNRVKIANESDADVLISIHMNKFEDSRYRGWQTFYSKNSEEGKALAENIQASISKCIDYENKRTALKIEGIKIIDKSSIPAVIVECGFLSNPQDELLLITDKYQDSVAYAIFKGIVGYLAQMSFNYFNNY